MGRLTLRLPDTLHQQLTQLAEHEGVSLNQYIVYALTRQATIAETIYLIPESEVNQQAQNFKALLQRLGQVSSTEIEAALAEREIVPSEPELTPEVVARLQQRIHNAANRT